MRKLTLYMITTVDGKYAGPDGNLDFYEPGADDMAFANGFFAGAGGIVFGRNIYQIFVDYWDALDIGPESTAPPQEIAFARVFRGMPRVVCSRTLDRVDDEHAVVVNDDLATRIAQIKAEPGADLVLICGSELVAAMLGHGLLDEIVFLVCPTLLGTGKPLLGDLTTDVSLDLIATSTFANGVQMVRYAVTPST